MIPSSIDVVTLPISQDLVTLSKKNVNAAKKVLGRTFNYLSHLIRYVHAIAPSALRTLLLAGQIFILAVILVAQIAYRLLFVKEHKPHVSRTPPDTSASLLTTAAQDTPSAATLQTHSAFPTTLETVSSSTAATLSTAVPDLNVLTTTSLTTMSIPGTVTLTETTPSTSALTIDSVSSSVPTATTVPDAQIGTGTDEVPTPVISEDNNKRRQTMFKLVASFMKQKNLTPDEDLQLSTIIQKLTSAKLPSNQQLANFKNKMLVRFSEAFEQHQTASKEMETAIIEHQTVDSQTLMRLAKLTDTLIIAGKNLILVGPAQTMKQVKAIKFL